MQRVHIPKVASSNPASAIKEKIMKKEDFILTKEVREALETGEKIEDLCCPDGFWYGIAIGGYIAIEDFIADENQIKKIKEALETLVAFQEIFEEAVEEY